MKFKLQTASGKVVIDRPVISLEDIVSVARMMGVKEDEQRAPGMKAPQWKKEEPFSHPNCKHELKTELKSADTESKIEYEDKTIKMAVKRSDAETPGPRKTVELRGSEHQTGFDIADAAKFEMDDLENRVTAKAICPDCGNITIDKVFPWFNFVKCSACSTKIYIKDDRTKPDAKYGDTKFFRKEEREEFKKEIKTEEKNKPTNWEPAPKEVSKISLDNKGMDISGHNININGVVKGDAVERIAGLLEASETEADKMAILEDFTIPQLKRYAANENIKIESTFRKNNIIDAICRDLYAREN